MARYDYPFSFTGLRVKGFNFVGDPHYSSRTPRRRTDDDFPGSVLNALHQANQISRDANLLTLCLGDLLDNAHEDDLHAINRLQSELMESHLPWIVNPGNHDMGDVRQVTEDTCLAVLRTPGLIRVVPRSGPIGIVEVDAPGHHRGFLRVGLGATPSGHDVPDDAWDMFPREGSEAVDFVIWMTHDKFDVAGNFPGAKPTFEIRGVDLVVNGDIHWTMPPLQRGGTTWFNPGNITRRTKSEIDHVEQVWTWIPGDMQDIDGDPIPRSNWGMGFVRPIPLNLPRDVFDLTGYLVKAADGRKAVPDGADDEDEEDRQRKSAFVDMMKTDSAFDMPARADGQSIMRDEIDDLLRQLEQHGIKIDPTASKLIRLIAVDGFEPEKIEDMALAEEMQREAVELQRAAEEDRQMRQEQAEQHSLAEALDDMLTMG